MKTQEKLNMLTKSIRMTNQAKIHIHDIDRIEKLIEELQQTKWALEYKADSLEKQAHDIQRKAIEVKILPEKEYTEEGCETTQMTPRTLKDVFSAKEISKLLVFSKNYVAHKTAPIFITNIKENATTALVKLIKEKLSIKRQELTALIAENEKTNPYKYEIIKLVQTNSDFLEKGPWDYNRETETLLLPISDYLGL